MLKNKNKKKKKKGFTLIELVIVLAVLAIIALIAIPNFTKVRNNAKIDADIRTAEQIEKITHMALTDGSIPTQASNYTITSSATGVSVEYKAGVATRTGANSGSSTVDVTKYKDLLREVEAPQVQGGTGYLVSMDADGDVSVGYSGTPTLTGARKWLSGPKAKAADNVPVGSDKKE